jgi:ribosome-binding factor A
VTDVEVTDDLRLARVFVTVLGDENANKAALIGLGKAAGFIRSELGRRVQLRYTPELVFHQDITGMRGDRVLSLLRQALAQDQKAEETGEQGTKTDGAS